MENYQMFFPISALSSSSAVAAQSLPLNNMAAPNSQGFNNFNGNTSVDHGFFGLKNEDFIQKPAANEDSKEFIKSGQKVMGKKIKKPRCAFQTRSQVDILDDGYRWRKYGQKAVKNNKFPRSYYRCTHEGCNVKKQVQRLTKDETVVVTTYEGMHTHPIQKPSDNFEHILSQMQIYTPF